MWNGLSTSSVPPGGGDVQEDGEDNNKVLVESGSQGQPEFWRVTECSDWGQNDC